MRHGSKFVAALFVGVATLGVPATVEAAAGAEARDPNEKVCETESQIGSRLAKKKTCATRAEWAVIRKDQKDALEQIQRQGSVACMPDYQSSSSGSRC